MKWKYDLKLLLFPLDAFAHIVHSQVKGTSLLDNAPNQLFGCFIQKTSTILYIYIRKLIWWKKEIIFCRVFLINVYMFLHQYTHVFVYTKLKFLSKAYFMRETHIFIWLFFLFWDFLKKELFKRDFWVY